MSHRKLDARKSTPLRPYQTHLEADQEQLDPGQPTFARVEMMPFDHVFRAGSSLRLTISAPTRVNSGDNALFTPRPSMNSVYFSPRFTSQLVLARVPDAKAGAGLPACNSVDVEPCRPNVASQPDGTINLADAPVAPSAG